MGSHRRWRGRRTLLAAFAAGALLAALAAGALVAQDGYVQHFTSVDGGGGRVTAGGYSLVSALGQPDAGQTAAGIYTLTGGVLAAGGGGAVTVPDMKVHLPLISK